MDINEFIENPPQGCEVVANHLRQGVAKLQQSQKAHEEAAEAVTKTQAQLNSDNGAYEALKSVAQATYQAVYEAQQAAEEEHRKRTAVADNTRNVRSKEEHDAA